jgi:predicted unusual protein kinase regulating ubiquinone biosynthesis (AarF/ABC1/UbiB family)
MIHAAHERRGSTMTPAITELLAAWPQDEPSSSTRPTDDRLKEIFEQLTRRPVPTGSWQRLWTLGGLQARLALAYLAWYMRTWFHSPDQKQQQLLETNLRSALQTLEAMGYLRGAVMKVGQALALLPELVPDEFADLLGRLHFEAPPMHYSLVREQLAGELGGDPEEVFASFEPDAFAAASLGQVHRACLPTREQVAVKVQYPGIARTIRTDITNLRRLLFPLRLSTDWDSLNAQFGEVQAVLESETDYEQEAAFLREARAAFREAEGIVVPRVYEQYSTRRVLTMDYVAGDHIQAFLAGNPSQELRNHFGERILRASLRLYLSRRMLYSDFNPGNLLFRKDGRLGWIDFGGLRRFDDAEWALLREAHEAMRSTDRGQVLAYIQRSLMFTDQEMQSRASIVEFVEEWAKFYWEPLRTASPFDYGDPAFVNRGIGLWKRAAEVRVIRQQPVNVFMHRCNFELVALLYRLRSRVDCRRIYDEELAASGW